MNLIIDIGNTRVKLALFQKNALIEKAIWETLTLEALTVWLKKHTVQNVILTASGQITEGVVDWLKAHYFFIQLDHTTPIPIINDYGTPQTLGKDRLAAVIAAFYHFPKQNCLVLDSGTCITYNVINAKGHFLGGNIAPGLNMRLKAMHHFTAKLPLLQPNTEGVSEINIIGNSTKNAMLNGAHWGIVAEVEGMIQRFKKEFKGLKVIVTGGDGYFIHNNITTYPTHFEENLVLKGLNFILNYNIK